ncbi:hypothetical protein ASZ78_006174 [Callipepla squamata]|uniref:Protein FAM136A n=1 Tax=Callipepla squamata TaxID=9009 RepID=A0A226N2Q1_CALSU|nr:hypothetical protein ASZ78_006174 [Callipepla squamata]
MAEAAQGRVQEAVEKVVQELERDSIRGMQDRLSRCTLHCSDRAKDALEAGGGETRARSQLDACVAACGDEHLRLVPSMAKRMRDGLAALQH